MISEQFWIGPFGVLVSNKIESVIADDGYNTLFKNGYQTKM